MTIESGILLLTVKQVNPQQWLFLQLLCEKFWPCRQILLLLNVFQHWIYSNETEKPIRQPQNVINFYLVQNDSRKRPNWMVTNCSIYIDLYRMHTLANYYNDITIFITLWMIILSIAHFREYNPVWYFVNPVGERNISTENWHSYGNDQCSFSCRLILSP